MPALLVVLPSCGPACSAPRASVASSGRRFPPASDPTGISDWLPSPAGGRGGDLSLGFNAGAGSAALPAASLQAAGLWGSAASRQAAAALGYGAINAAAGDVGMVVVAPAGSFHHQRAAAAADDPVFPLVAAAEAAQRALDADAAAKQQAAAASGGAIQLWHQQPATAAADGSPCKKPLAMLDYGRGVAGAVSGSGGTTCHDCGNQAKKGCAHNRCRTCCNSRGFDCDTHVRSTWVPAARRRERLQLATAGSPPPPSGAAKKPRLLTCHTTTTTTTNSRTSASNVTTPRSLDTSSSHQDASFKDGLPRQVREPAVFRCVRVTSVDSGDAEVAYQAAVTINGHLFRGLLYDHGAEADDRAALPAATNSDLHLGSASTAVHDLYGGGGGGGALILGGLGYGNTP
ncbi:hypothetical protein ACP70R_034458 [Stipagrostis hirtigluma subsp. patula]